MIWALHGAVGMAADWRDFAQKLPKRFGEPRRVDLWRFLDCCPMSLKETGRAIATEISHIDKAPILLGYSMGGRLALHSLLEKPNIWHAAIIVSAHSGLENESDKEARREKDAEWSALALKSDWGDFLQRWNNQSILSDSQILPERSALKDRRASIARSFIDWSLGQQENLLERFNQIHCPILWVTGEDDDKFIQLARKAVNQLPNAKHEIVSHAGHRVPWEQPMAFSQIVQKFLDDHFPLHDSRSA